MAEDLVRVGDDPEAEPDILDDDLHDDAPPYQQRFQLLFGVLLGIGLAAVAATVVFVASDDPAPRQQSVRWSSWKPGADNGIDAVKQIARHVGQRYSLPSGNQLVAVKAGRLEVAGLPVTVAIERLATESSPGDIQIIDGEGVLYTMCGLGKDCAIKEGKASFARHLVLRREALELALYTFRYISNVDQVVALMPPARGDKPDTALYFRRQDIGSSLDRPLSRTLPGVPPVPPKVRKPEQEFIDQLTNGNLFKFRYTTAQDASVVLVLNRPDSG